VMGRSGVERTMPVKVTAAPASGWLAWKAVRRAPGSKGDSEMMIISAAGHGGQDGHGFRVGNGGFPWNDVGVFREFELLWVGHGEVEGFVIGAEPDDQVGESLDLGGRCDFVAGTVEALAQPGKV